MRSLRDGRYHVLNKLYQSYCRRPLLGLHLGLLAAAGALYLVSRFTRNPSFSDYAYALFVLDIFFWLIHRNQQGLYKYMTMNKDVSHVPEHQIHLINTFFLTGFLILTGGLMFLFVHIPYQGVWNTVKAFFTLIIRWILQHIFQKESVHDEKILLPDIGKAFYDGSSSGNVSVFAQVLERIFGCIAVLIILVLLILFLFVLYRKLITQTRGTEMEIREFVSPKASREKVSRPVSHEKPRFFSQSPEGKIRKLYFRTIQLHLNPKKGISKSMTPTQIEDFAKLPQGAALSQLHSAYEKARYGMEPCDKSDLEMAKQGAARLKRTDAQ